MTDAPAADASPVVPDFSPVVPDASRAAGPPVLAYAAAGPRRSFARALRVLAAVAWTTLAATPPLMMSFDTEVIIITGVTCAAAAVAMLVLGSVAGRRRYVVLSTAHLVVACGVFLVIYRRRWSPGDAHAPVLFAAGLAAAAAALPTWRAVRGGDR